MHQGDQTVLSLRPGGGRGGGSCSRLFGSFYAGLPLLRPDGGAPSSFYTKAGDSQFEARERVRYTRDQLLDLREAGDSQFEAREHVRYSRDQLLNLREAGDSRFEARERVQYTRDQLLDLREAVEVPNGILKIKKDTEAELFGGDRSWGRAESNAQILRTWFGRSGQLPPSAKDRSWENLRENREFGNRYDSRQQDGSQINGQDQQSSQFAKGGPAPILVEAEVPWSARRGSLSEKNHVLKTGKEILNTLTPEKFDVEKGQLIDAGITSADQKLKAQIQGQPSLPKTPQKVKALTVHDYAIQISSTASSQETPQFKPISKSLDPSKSFAQTLSANIVEFNPFYVQKHLVQPICTLDNDQIKDYPMESASLIFPNTKNEGQWHFIPSNLEKSRTFYELILVHTKSIAISHRKGSDGNLYSLVQILNVLSKENWNQNVYLDKKFSITFHPSSFNYIDYQEAWYSAFFLQNYSHSWFIHFHKNCQKSFPNWFIDWFELFGPIKNILPKPIQKAYYLFKESTKFLEDLKLFFFFVYFKIPWVVYWDYDIQRACNPALQQLVRIFKVKWWPKYNLKYCTTDSIKYWISHNPKFVDHEQVLFKKQQQFLNEKTQFLSQLALVTNAQELKKILSETLSAATSTGGEENEEDPLDQNEDDFDIDFEDDEFSN